MVKKVSVILVYDLSGGQADETVKFGVDGTGYEIDLNLRNAQDLRVLLARYIEKGRKITSPASRPSRSPGRQRTRLAIRKCGPGRKSRASRSATADAYLPKSSLSTRQRPSDRSNFPGQREFPPETAYYELKTRTARSTKPPPGAFR
jgi:hypothetical protein